MSGVNFDRPSAELIVETVRRNLSAVPSLNPGGPQVSERYRPPICGVLLEDIDPATHPRTGASWAWGLVWSIDPNQPPTADEPRKLQRTTRRERIVNRSVVRSAAKGTYFEAEWKDAEWRGDFDCETICQETCEWTWEEPTSLPGAWAMDSVSGCTGDCECVEPDFNGDTVGAHASTDCEDPDVLDFEAE